MTDKDTTVSPYLLRPLRTLEQVLGGRSRAAESTRDNIEATPPCNEQGAARDRGREAPRRPPD